MKTHIITAVAALLMCGNAWGQPLKSSCWILTNLKGDAVYKQDGYKRVPDGFTRMNPRIRLTLASGRAHASDDNMELVQVDDYVAVGVARNDSFAATETYVVDPSSGVVLYTKAVFGHGLFDAMTGTKMFKGSATPCE